MKALLEAPDGAAAVQRQGGAADPFPGSPRVATQAQVSGEDAGAAAGRRGGDAQLGISDAKIAGVPQLHLARGERDLQGRHVLEQALLAIAELPAAREQGLFEDVAAL